ncbi:MAG TPA: hypothetical protein V6D19_05705 [Stenomitos sp.]
MPPINRPQYEGTLTPRIEEFVYSILTELSPDKITQEEIDELLRCPVVKAPITAITLIGLSYFGDYTHKDEKIQTFIRGCFEKMKGSLRTTFAQMMSAIYIGNACAEWGVVPDKKNWILDKILVLQPGRYTFMGTMGEIDQVRYYSNRQIDIPYSQILHIVNNPHLAFNDPGGISDLSTAIAAVKAWKILMAEMVIAGQRKATPLTVGYYDPDAPATPLYNADGTPQVDEFGEQLTELPQEQLAGQLQGLENRTVLVTSAKNKVEPVANNADPDFFVEALRICHKLILMSFLFPETGLEAIGSGGSGDSNLNKGHMALLRLNVEQLADRIKEEMLEKLVRPLIQWNFGDQEDWGSFANQPQKEEDRLALFDALVGAVVQQVFSVDDLNVINKLYELAGLPTVEKLPTPDQPDQGFGLGLTDLDFGYWRQFETNGHAHTH